MTSHRLWPVTTAIAVLMAGSVSIELWASLRDHGVEHIAIESSVVTGEDAEPEPMLEPFGTPLSPLHLHARELARRGELEDAANKLSELAVQYPDDPSILTERAHLALRLSRPKQACEMLQGAAMALPQTPVVFLDLARCQHLLDQELEAMATLRAGVQLHPNHSGLLLELGEMLREQGELVEASRVLEPASTRGSNDERARALASLGRCHVASGDLVAARIAFEEAVQRAPASVNTWIRVARGFMQSDDPADQLRAVEYALRATRLAPELPLVHGVLGRAYEALGSNAAATAAYRTAVRLDRDYAFARRRLVRLSLDAEDYRLARQHAEALVAIDADIPEHHFLVGLVAFRSGDLDSARQHYQRALEKTPDGYPEALYNLGLLERQAKRPTEAIAAYERAIEQRPEFRAAHNNLGLVYLDLHEFERARSAFRKALDLDPKYVAAWVNLARCLSDEEKFEEAIQAYQSAMALSPLSRSMTIDYAIVLRKTGRAVEAIALYERLLDADPRYVTGWYNLGVALQAAGQTARAQQAYERALSIDPEHLKALKKLAQLEAKSGLREPARAHLTDALDRDPGDQGLRLELAQLFLTDNDRAACSHAARLILAQVPGHEAAKALLDRCVEPQ